MDIYFMLAMLQLVVIVACFGHRLVERSIVWLFKPQDMVSPSYIIDIHLYVDLSNVKVWQIALSHSTSEMPSEF